MRSTTRWVVGAAAVAGSALVLRPGTSAHRVARRRLHLAGRRLRNAGGRLQAVCYRLQGGHPDPNVSDLVLTDRIRSTLGPLEKRLDVPRVNVMVEDHVALLHGVVPTELRAEEIEETVAAMDGVRGVESYIHIGLTVNDTRPSAGRHAHDREPSVPKQRLLEAATNAGVHDDAALPVVRAILATFAERLPAAERDQVAAHLPADVRALFVAPRRIRLTKPVRRVDELISTIAGPVTALPSDKAADVTQAVLETLRLLVPDEAADLAAVLPARIRQLW